MRKKGARSTTHPMEWDEAMRFMRAVKCPRNRLYLHFGFFTAFRISDILKLRWCDILRKKNYSTIEQKSGKKRYLPFNEVLKRQIRRSYAALGKPDREQYIFIPKRGGFKDTHMTVDGMNKTLKKLIKKHDVEIKHNVSSHFLRKTFAKRLYDKTGDIALIMKILNHSSPEMTLAYLGFDNDKIEEAYLNIHK